MYQGIIYIVKASQDFADMFDGLTYRFKEGEETPLPKGVGVHFLDRNRDKLKLVRETHGRLPEPSDQIVSLVNTGQDTLTCVWDDLPYVFKPGVPLSLDKAIALYFKTQHPALVDETELAATSPTLAQPSPEPEAQPDPEPEPKAQKPKAKRSKKQ